MVQHLQREGDRYVLVIEPELAAQAGLTEEVEVEVAVAGNAIVITPLPFASQEPSSVSPGESKEEELLRRLAE
jgi:antitoxin component of MazEF toxin-antitoxin module